ncbi:hypothetical protein IFO70_30885 [Phormidium tenue FACHB-886]|nr:hypothetical protein [Phormidium tenue FACHB-886]
MSKEIHPNRRYFSTTTVKPIELPIEGELPSLAGATTWLNSQPINDRQFEIEFLEAGVEVFAFTFG